MNTWNQKISLASITRNLIRTESEEQQISVRGVRGQAPVEPSEVEGLSLGSTVVFYSQNEGASVDQREMDRRSPVGHMLKLDQAWLLCLLGV